MCFCRDIWICLRASSLSMANEDASAKSSNDANSELFVNISNSSNQMLSTHKLNGNNFAQWKRSAEITLLARNKLGFVKGTCSEPSSDSADLLKWQRCDSIVISWYCILWIYL